MSRRGITTGHIAKVRAALAQHPGLTPNRYAEMCGLTRNQVYSNLQWLLTRGEVERELIARDTMASGEHTVGYVYRLTDFSAPKKADPAKLPRVDAALLAQLWPIPELRRYEEAEA